MLLAVGTVIGSGIFIVPGTVMAQVGHVGPALLVWLVAGVLSLLGALTYGELGAMDSRAGGLYVYVRDAFGRTPAFLYGWALFFVIASGSVATLAVAFTSYLRQLVPLGPTGGHVAALAMIAVVTIINVRGTRGSASVQVWSTLLKAGAIAAISLVLVVRGSGMPAGADLWPADFTPALASAAGVAMIGTLWAYEGWQYVTFAAGEARDPQRTFPAGIVAGTAILIVLYLLANVGYVQALGPDGVAASQSVAADAVRVHLGDRAAQGITVVVLVAMFSAANGITLTATRVYWAMSRDGVFFRSLGRVHPRFGTPALAVAAGSGWAAILALSGTFEQLLTYVVFVGWIFYGLGAASVFWYRRRQPERPRPFRTPGYPVTPILFVAAAGAIVVNTLVSQPLESLLGIGVVLLGMPAYLLWTRNARRPPTTA
ncbi:MAG: amino acid permease [Longimicrobiales bacterium]